MWVEFAVGSLPCSKRFFSGYSSFPLSTKTNTSKFHFDQESGRRRTILWMCYLQIIIYLFVYLFIYLFVISGVDPSGNVLFMVQCEWILILRVTIVFHCFCSTFNRCLEITEVLWFDSESIWWVASFALTKTVQFIAAMYVLPHVTIIVENSSGAFKVMFWFWNFILRFGISIRILPASVWNQVCPRLWV